MKLFYMYIRMSVALSLSFIIWLIFFFGFHQSFWPSTIYALSGGILFFVVFQSYAYYSFLKKHKLTRKEYDYIRKNLREAQAKIKRIRKTYSAVRSIRTFRQTFTIHRLVKRIYAIVKNEPKRFYQAERFFFYHLDSLVELSEKHAFLVVRSLNNEKITQSLRETQDMLDELITSVEADLDTLLSTDVEHLTFELDVAKHSLHTWSTPLKERRSNHE